MKPKLLLPFISLIGAIFISCNNSLKNDAFLRQPKKVNTVIDQYVSNGSFPFLYMRMENKAGEVIYEHQAVNDSLLPNTKIELAAPIMVVDFADELYQKIDEEKITPDLIFSDDETYQYFLEKKDLEMERVFQLIKKPN